MNALNIITILMLVGWSVWVLCDALAIGIRKTGAKHETGKASESGPVVWMLFSLLMGIVGLPCYLIKRARHLRERQHASTQAALAKCPSCGTALTIDSSLMGQTVQCPCSYLFQAPSAPKSGFLFSNGPTAIGWGLYVVWVGLVAFSFLWKSSSELTMAQLENEVRKSMEQRFAADKDMRAVRVKDLRLIHTSGSKYDGKLTADVSAVPEFREAIAGGDMPKTMILDVDVTYDGRTFAWNLEGDEFARATTQVATTRKPSAPTRKPETPKVETTEYNPAQSPAARRAAREAEKAKAEPLTWNTKELDAAQNGNIAVAIEHIHASPMLKTKAVNADPALVAKAPWNYYGKVLKFTGVVEVAQDYPPSSELPTAFKTREASEMVIVCGAQETIVDMFCAKSSGRIKAGDTVTVYGYPVGITEVPNRLGGTFTHLVVVGNDYDAAPSRVR